jgi:hypothetical protein
MQESYLPYSPQGGPGHPLVGVDPESTRYRWGQIPCKY